MSDITHQKLEEKLKIHKLKKVYYLLFNISNNIIIQNKTVFLEDIFHFKEKENINRIKLLKGKRKLRGETEKEYQIRLLENQSFNDKLDPNYVKKMSLILYDSINYKDYAKKRNNLNKTIYKDIGNNKLRLTFKKFPINLIKTPIKNDLNKDNNKYKNEKSRNILFLTPSNKLYQNKFSETKEKNNIFNENITIKNEIKEILYNDQEKISIQEEKRIYNKIKPNFPYLKAKLIKQLKSPIFTPLTVNEFSKINLIKTPKISQIQNQNNSLLLQNKTKSTFFSNINIHNIFNTCNSLKVLRDKEKLNKEILSNKQELYKKIKEELNPVKELKRKKKIYLSQYEVFHYNTKKWNQIRKEKEFNKDIHEFNNINRIFNGSIDDMKQKVKNLKEMKNKIHNSGNDINELF